MAAITGFLGAVLFSVILGTGLHILTSSIFGFIIVIVLSTCIMFILNCTEEAISTINKPGYRPGKFKSSNPYTKHNYR